MHTHDPMILVQQPLRLSWCPYAVHHPRTLPRHRTKQNSSLRCSIKTQQRTISALTLLSNCLRALLTRRDALHAQAMVNALVGKVQTGPDTAELMYKAIGVRISHVILFEPGGEPSLWFYTPDTPTGTLMRRSEAKTSLALIREELRRCFDAWGCLEPRREFVLLRGVGTDGAVRQLSATWPELQSLLCSPPPV